jgi:hypothetical protein
MEVGLDGCDEKAIHRLVEKSWRKERCKSSWNWFFLLLLGLVDVLWVVRKGDSLSRKNENREGDGSAFALFASLFNYLTYADTCYQLAMGEGSREIPSYWQEERTLEHLKRSSPYILALSMLPTGRWTGLDAWSFLKAFSELLSSHLTGNHTWVTTWARIREDLRREVAIPDIGRFKREIKEYFSRLVDPVTAGIDNYNLIQFTNNPQDVDPQFALEQFQGIASEQAVEQSRTPAGVPATTYQPEGRTERKGRQRRRDGRRPLEESDPLNRTSISKSVKSISLACCTSTP